MKKLYNFNFTNQNILICKGINLTLFFSKIPIYLVYYPSAFILKIFIKKYFYVTASGSFFYQSNLIFELIILFVLSNVIGQLLFSTTFLLNHSVQSTEQENITFFDTEKYSPYECGFAPFKTE